MTVIKVVEDGVDWQEVGDEIVVLDTNNSVYLRIAGAGKPLWPLLVEGTTIDHLTGYLVQRFGIDVELAGRDSADFVDQLVKKQLVVKR